MCFIKSDHRISVKYDTIETALLKKTNKKSLSRKTLDKLSRIACETYGLTRQEAKGIFFREGVVASNCKTAKLSHALTHASSHLSVHPVRKEIDKFIKNCGLTINNSMLTENIKPNSILNVVGSQKTSEYDKKHGVSEIVTANIEPVVEDITKPVKKTVESEGETLLKNRRESGNANLFIKPVENEAFYDDSHNKAIVGTNTDIVLSQLKPVSDPEGKNKIIEELDHTHLDDYRLYTDDKENGSYFNIEYKPHKWTIYSVKRNKSAEYFTNEIIKYQYSVISSKMGFSGVMPSVIKNRYIYNGITLAETKNKSDLDLLYSFLNNTPNGKLTNRVLQDFGLKVLAVTQKEVVTRHGNKRTNIYTYVHKEDGPVNKLE
ncbi:hypothetical protein ACQYRI_19555 [Salmonella enterica]